MSNSRFPNDTLLVSASWLADHIGDPDLCLVEVTPPGTGYGFGHLPGAVYLNMDEVLTGKAGTGPRAIRPVEEIAALLGRLGLATHKQVVIYDEIGGPNAAQAFWLMEYLGVAQVCVLEGGVERWMAEGRDATRSRPSVKPITFVPILREDALATAEWIASRLKADDMCLVDCRTPQEYEQGHVPGAINRDWERSITLHAYHGFREADELRAELTALGVAENKTIVTYCSTGHRSAHTYLTLRLLGYRRLRNYCGSWTEWERRPDLPKVRGR